MTVQLNHTILRSHDAPTTAAFVSEVLGLAAPVPFGPFLTMPTANGVSLDVLEVSDVTPVESQHYAFLVSEQEFDQIMERLAQRGVDHFADPGAHAIGEINTHDGGRGAYFFEPGGHYLEIITVPYGGWPADS